MDFEQVWFTQSTLTKCICLLRSYLILWSDMWTGGLLYTGSSMILMGLVIIALSGSEMYFLSYEIWNTLCMCPSSTGRFSRWCAGFNFRMTSYGQIYLRLNLPLTAKLHCPWLVTLSRRSYHVLITPEAFFFLLA